MENTDAPKQFEVILDQFQNVKVIGGNLKGDIDYMFSLNLALFPPDEKLKTIFLVTPTIITTDTSGTIVEMQAEIILNIYKYDHPFTAIDLYGLFCHAYIVGYHVIQNEIIRLNILHDDEIYIPTKTIPSYEAVKGNITTELKKVYG